MMRAIGLILAIATASAFAADGDVAGFDDHRGAALPNAVFVDDDGATVQLSQFFQKPFYLAFAYHTCPQLCGLVLGRFAAALREVPGRASEAFDVVVVSIDPHDTPQRSRDAKQRYAARYGSRGEGWHFLSGNDAEIHALAQAAGFRYLFDPMRNIFVHPAGVFYIGRGGIVQGHVEGTDFTAASLLAANDAPTSTLSRLCGALGIGNGVHSAAVIAMLRAAIIGMLIAVAGFVAWRVGKAGAAR
jgi:protein SCO1/2